MPKILSPQLTSLSDEHQLILYRNDEEIEEYEFEEDEEIDAGADDNVCVTDETVHLKPLACSESKEDTKRRALAAFVDVYIVMGKPIDALQTVEFYRVKSKGIKYSHDINILNTLMNGFSKKKNWHKLKYVFNLILADKMQPNVQSFVPIFECFGRFLNNDKEFPRKSDIDDFLNVFHKKYVSVIAFCNVDSKCVNFEIFRVLILIN